MIPDCQQFETQVLERHEIVYGLFSVIFVMGFGRPDSGRLMMKL